MISNQLSTDPTSPNPTNLSSPTLIPNPMIVEETDIARFHMEEKIEETVADHKKLIIPPALFSIFPLFIFTQEIYTINASFCHRV